VEASLSLNLILRRLTAFLGLLPGDLARHSKVNSCTDTSLNVSHGLHVNTTLKMGSHYRTTEFRP
jgi:hypothetical protein